MLYNTLNDHPLFKKQFENSTKTYDKTHFCATLCKYLDHHKTLVNSEDRLENIIKIHNLYLINYKVLGYSKKFTILYIMK